MTYRHEKIKISFYHFIFLTRLLAMLNIFNRDLHQSFIEISHQDLRDDIERSFDQLNPDHRLYKYFSRQLEIQNRRLNEVHD